MKIINAHDVARWRLCVGCGACFSLCPEGLIKLVDVESEGIRPFVDPEVCQSCGTCLRACPGLQSPSADENLSGKKKASYSTKRWRPFIEVWEGFASDPKIRFNGSSGGLCTALSLFCLENGIAGEVIHTGSILDKPWKNQTVRSTNKHELLKYTGSRYSPASPCDGFADIEASPGQSVFIGKPCDVEALRLAQGLRPELKAKTALAIGFFCAGTPSTRGTLDLFEEYGVNKDDISSFRYRGMGWPGMATINFKDKNRPAVKMTYQKSWGFVNNYRPFRCYLCPDLTSEFADISVGDPWYREVGESEPGRSLILIRTAKGREIFYQAMAKGYISGEKSDPEIISLSQQNLLGKRQAIWGRLFAFKILGIPAPKLEGFYLFKNWKELLLKEKARSILGTLKRIIQRKYYKPVDYSSVVKFDE